MGDVTDIRCSVFEGGLGARILKTHVLRTNLAEDLDSTSVCLRRVEKLLGIPLKKQGRREHVSVERRLRRTMARLVNQPMASACRGFELHSRNLSKLLQCFALLPPTTSNVRSLIDLGHRVAYTRRNWLGSEWPRDCSHRTIS